MVYASLSDDEDDDEDDESDESDDEEVSEGERRSFFLLCMAMARCVRAGRSRAMKQWRAQSSRLWHRTGIRNEPHQSHTN